MTTRTYSSPAAFKQALEQRLRSATNTGAEFARKRQLLVFDRFLARIVATLGDTATLKGGLVLELRLERARTTKDVDLRLMDSQGGILERLQEVGRQDLGDFMTFEVGPDKVLFELYFEKKAETDKRRQEKHAEFSLEYALSQVFSPKQKELFGKKLEGLPLTKTEKEYYSRTVKKKVVALANDELHSLAKKLLEF